MARPPAVKAVKFVDPGELLAELLDALGGKAPFNMVMRHAFGLSPLDVDSERCRGREARLWWPTVGEEEVEEEATATAPCNSAVLPKLLGIEYRSGAGAGYCCGGRRR